MAADIRVWEVTTMARSFVVKYLGATSHKGSRMVAVDTFGKRVVKAFDYELSTEQNAREAAIACSYAAGLGRPMEMLGATTKDGWVFIASTWESGVQNGGELNGEGLTWLEWLAASTIRRPTLMHTAAWQRGEDPADYRLGVHEQGGR
jgi:hypothetical protein